MGEKEGFIVNVPCLVSPAWLDDKNLTECRRRRKLFEGVCDFTAAIVPTKPNHHMFIFSL